MKEKILYHGIPIVGRMPPFRADMRQAIRDERKGQTRRVIKGIPKEADIITCSTLEEDDKGNLWCSFGSSALPMDPGGYETIYQTKCPYGKPGDVRCMCESLIRVYTVHHLRDGITYYSDYTPVISLITGDPLKWQWQRDHLASIHMPTEAARTVCKITDIRVEQLQEISRADAKAEGFWPGLNGLEQSRGRSFGNAQLAFIDTWNSINAKRGYGWDVSQMVWRIKFEKLEV